MRTLALLALAFSLWAGCNPGHQDSVVHGSVTAGGCQTCLVDSGTFYDDCAKLPSRTYLCVGTDLVDGGSGACTAGSCMQTCSSSLDCSQLEDCVTRSSAYGDTSVCVTTR